MACSDESKPMELHPIERERLCREGLARRAATFCWFVIGAVCLPAAAGSIELAQSPGSSGATAASPPTSTMPPATTATPPGTTNIPPATTATPPGTTNIPPATTATQPGTATSPPTSVPPNTSGIPPARVTPPGSRSIPPVTTSPSTRSNRRSGGGMSTVPSLPEPPVSPSVPAAPPTLPTPPDSSQLMSPATPSGTGTSVGPSSFAPQSAPDRQAT